MRNKQAYIMNFRSGTELLKTFEKISLKSKKSSKSKQKKDGPKPSGSKTKMSSIKRKPTSVTNIIIRGMLLRKCKRSAAQAAKKSVTSMDYRNNLLPNVPMYRLLSIDVSHHSSLDNWSWCVYPISRPRLSKYSDLARSVVESALLSFLWWAIPFREKYLLIN